MTFVNHAAYFFYWNSHQLQAEVCLKDLQAKHQYMQNEAVDFSIDLPKEKQASEVEMEPNNFNFGNDASKDSSESIDTYSWNIFLKRFSLKLWWVARIFYSVGIATRKITFNYLLSHPLQICCWGQIGCFPHIPSMG